MLNEIKKALDKTFGPPAEGIKVFHELTTGETGRRLDKLFTRIEHLSKDTSSLLQVIELLKLIQELNRSGALDKLIELLGLIPKGKSGQALVAELGKVIDGLGPRLDKLSALASALLGKED